MKPVPLLALALVSDAGAGETIAIRTGLDGKSVQQAPAGSYHLRSISPVTFANRAYAWNVAVLIRNRQTTLIELTSANAIVDSSAASIGAVVRVSPRHIAPEVGVYEKVKRGIF